MAKTNVANETPSTQPQYTTQHRQILQNGLVRGIDNSVWVYRVIPPTAIKEAPSLSRRLAAANSLQEIFEGVAKLTHTTMNRRRLSAGSYRDIHLLSIQVPKVFTAPTVSPLAERHNASFGAYSDNPIIVPYRLTLVGVKLIDSFTRRELSFKDRVKDAVEGFVADMLEGVLPLDSFMEDYRLVDAVLARAGTKTPSEEQWGLATGWWNRGRAPNLPLLVHPDHLHAFTSMSAAQSAGLLVQRDPTACDQFASISNQFAFTMAHVTGFDGFVTEERDAALWAANLLDRDVRAISVRGKLEPAKVTAAELKSNSNKVDRDIREARGSGQMPEEDVEEYQAQISAVRGTYARGEGAHTLVSTSVTVAIDDIQHDVTHWAGGLPVHLTGSVTPLGAFLETQICSSVRANQYLLDWPIQNVTHAGFSDLSVAGDPQGALVGFSETHNQPMYVSTEVAFNAEKPPLTLVPGSTGSGKSTFLIHAATQWAQIPTPLGEKTPVTFVDLKPHSDFSGVVKAFGGTVYRLDDLMQADGVFDPLRITADPTRGQAAAAMLLSLDPWGGRWREMEVPLTSSLEYGVKNGATCIGEALLMAESSGKFNIPDGMVKGVLDMAEGSQHFRALVGLTPGNSALSTNQGLSLIMAGSSYLQIPSKRTPRQLLNLSVRTDLWVLRMCVMASAASMARRFGVLILDEAHMFATDEDAAAELQRLGRLARSWKVRVVLASQKMQEFLQAGLKGYISDGFVLPLEHESAVEAFELFNVEVSPERLNRLAQPALTDKKLPNRYSMHVLRDPQTGKLLRGTLAYMVDTSGQVIPFEIVLEAETLRLIEQGALIERENSQK